jgi:polyketide biosynthesis acyl carrier protein
MTRDEIGAVVRRNLAAVLNDPEAAEAPAGASLDDLGANSLERLDILLATLDDLGLARKAGDFVGCPSIDALVDRLHGCYAQQ